MCTWREEQRGADADDATVVSRLLGRAEKLGHEGTTVVHRVFGRHGQPTRTTSMYGSVCGDVCGDVCGGVYGRVGGSGVGGDGGSGGVGVGGGMGRIVVPLIAQGPRQAKIDDLDGGPL